MKAVLAATYVSQADLVLFCQLQLAGASLYSFTLSHNYRLLHGFTPQLGKYCPGNSQPLRDPRAAISKRFPLTRRWNTGTRILVTCLQIISYLDGSLHNMHV
ncbi:hypothetical protein CY34DRAFT_324899 [Suillus luteus UH-Slu-Lm8-n1]|uniref:Uncharacterized protein n=1 Tax=Suillus luteus UH-Slu-Lm8-n1 TaxID=930992 RepID=A0A0D0AZ39_9AGAM|nr:hypothetical protein CY34DRAFT_324899 [Suillus luteus UH-Slu-Lm8-n1]